MVQSKAKRFSQESAHTLQVMNYFLVSSFGQVTSNGRTDRRTESDAYEPTVHKHRCAQKCGNPSENKHMAILTTKVGPAANQKQSSVGCWKYPLHGPCYCQTHDPHKPKFSRASRGGERGREEGQYNRVNTHHHQ